MVTRRSFFASSALALAGAGCASAPAEKPVFRAAHRGTAAAPFGRCRFRLGMAGYTYYKFSVDETLAALEKFGVRGLCVKDKHVPYDASPAYIREFLKKCGDHGVTPYGAGPISIGTADEMKKRFDYAAALGVPTLVGVPWMPGEDGSKAWGKTRSNPELCALAANLASEYKINFAIHNHGANPKTGVPTLFPTPDAIMAIVKDMGPRIGLCMDIAYTYADGFDPAATIRKYAGRVFDVHFRNICDPGNGSSGVNAKDGVIDYLSVATALADIGYTGWCGLELANAFAKKKDSANAWENGDPDWIPSSVGYFQAVIDSVR